MNRYRTHTCGALRQEHAGQTARLAGWVHRKRDHGNLLFVDLRDQYGLTQCVVDISSPVFKVLEAVRPESVVSVVGKVVPRSAETVNDKLATGRIELVVAEVEVLSEAAVLPAAVAGEQEYTEETRLSYRFLDLRREKMRDNILLRSQVIASIRRRMWDAGFVEFQTPILTASSPEGARDFLVPSRIHPGKFYALPQALAAAFKQLIMTSGSRPAISRSRRASAMRTAAPDRSPGEFYQCSISRMAFVTQDDVFDTIAPVLRELFVEFARGRVVSEAPFPRIPYAEAFAQVRQR